MTSVTFIDPARSAAFERDGYTVLPPIDRSVVAELMDTYDQLGTPAVTGMYSNVQGQAQAVNEEIARRIVEVLEPQVRDHILGYRVQGGVFIVKGAGDKSECPLHQDWNAVDESEAVGLVAWVPLVDVDRENGCLVVVPGTHRHDAFPTLRGPNVDSAHLPIEGVLKESVVSLPMRAGEICIFAQSLFHGSWTNRSDRTRVALYAAALPKDARMIQYLRDSSGAVRQVEVDEGFYYSGEAARWASGDVPPDLSTHPSVSADHELVAESELLRFVNTRRRP
ncbi:MAG: phytanoyl-CoA dioxygenase family protein [Acidimicrobiales bacterium]|nr:phytanoyl-CoA dioxygenase family protein [Acidimicrobiales bacterium]